MLALYGSKFRVCVFVIISVFLYVQDVYINRAKVREFQFQIDNLFGCSGKPFSCDVEIRHSDQLTVLPIEIQVCTSAYHFEPIL